MSLTALTCWGILPDFRHWCVSLSHGLPVLCFLDILYRSTVFCFLAYSCKIHPLTVIKNCLVLLAFCTTLTVLSALLILLSHIVFELISALRTCLLLSFFYMCLLW